MVPVFIVLEVRDLEESVRDNRMAGDSGIDYEDSGANGALIVAPYYNKPTQEGLYAHYKAIHDSVDIPIIVYNIPGRCGVDIEHETMVKLSKLPRIIGVKDATGDLSRPKTLRDEIGPDFLQFSGNDDTIIEFMENGGHGCISVTSNIAPELCARLHNEWQKGNKEEAKKIAAQHTPLHHALFLESSPIPAKYAAALLGLCRDDMRLPLLPATPASQQAINEAIKKVGLPTNPSLNNMKACG